MSGSVYKMRCPHCKQGMRVRNSVGLHPLLRSAFLQCTNLNCGATYRGQFEITHQLSPSACPARGLDLPEADHAMRLSAIPRDNQHQLHIEDVLG